MPKQTAVQIRTAKLIEYYKTIPNEFDLLKGILIASFPFEGNERKRIDSMFDGGMIATRMDAINAEVIATFKRETLSRAEIRDGTGFAPGARFIQAP